MKITETFGELGRSDTGFVTVDVEYSHSPYLKPTQYDSAEGGSELEEIRVVGYSYELPCGRVLTVEPKRGSVIERLLISVAEQYVIESELV